MKWPPLWQYCLPKIYCGGPEKSLELVGHRMVYIFNDQASGLAGRVVTFFEPKRIYNPMAIGFLAMFTFPLDNTNM